MIRQSEQAAQMRVGRVWMVEVVRIEQIGALGRARAGKRDEFGQVAVSVAVLRDRGEGERRRAVGVRQAKVRADQQLDACFLRRDVRAYDARERTLVGDGDRLVAELRCARGQFLGV